MNCKTCGNDHPVNYCPDCGEQVFNPHQLSVKHFVEETFEGFVHFDSKFFRTIKLLVTKPGQLSLDYADGKRIKYMKPIQFFLVVNLIFFIVPFRNMYTQGLDTFTTFTNYTKHNTVALVQKELKRTGLNRAEYRQVFDEKIKSLSKAFIFIYIPFYGLLFALLFWFKKQYFVEHLVFATHFMSFILLLGLFTTIFISFPFKLISHSQYSEGFDKTLGIAFVSLIVIYVGLAIHRFYRPHLIWTMLTAIAIGALFLPVMQYYRLLLFFKIIYLH